jgi:DNA-binding HxlR family transcriptional regulator
MTESNANADCTDEPPCYCPLGGVIDTMSKKYAIQVLCVVNAAEPVRFKEIESWLSGVSTSTLSDRLEDLVDEGLLERNQYDEIPPRVEYELTDDGRELGGLVEPLLEWAAERDGR